MNEAYEAQQTQHESPAPYRAFLLRMWRAGQSGWQASLHGAASNERIGFDSLEALFNFLLNETEETDRATPIGQARPANNAPPNPFGNA